MLLRNPALAIAKAVRFHVKNIYKYYIIKHENIKSIPNN